MTAMNSGYTTQYTRVGAVVTVSGQFNLTTDDDDDSTGIAEATMTIPVNSTFAGGEHQAAGTFLGQNGMHGYISADSANKVKITVFGGIFTVAGFFYNYTYLIV